MIEIGPRQVKAPLWLWGGAIAHPILKIWVMELEVLLEEYTVLYQVGKTGYFQSVCELWFKINPSIFSKSESTSTLGKRHFYVGVIHDSGHSNVDLLLKVGRAVNDVM
jgi:hypothetical protein